MSKASDHPLVYFEDYRARRVSIANMLLRIQRQLIGEEIKKKIACWHYSRLPEMIFKKILQISRILENIVLLWKLVENGFFNFIK